MKIISENQNSWLTLNHHSDEHGYSSFTVEASVDLNHSELHAKNNDIHFFNFQEFAVELEEFVLDRKKRPQLNGTYDTNIVFEGTNNNVIVSFLIGSAFSGEKTYSYALQGAFEINQEFLSEISAGMKRYAGTI